MPTFGGLGFGRMGVQGGAKFDAASLTLFAAMSTPPTAARKVQIDTAIKSIKASGAWTLLDALWVLAAADSQAAYLNWKNPATFTLVETGTAPTFTADRGVTGNGTTSGLTGPNLSTFGGQFSLNNAHLGVWCGTDVLETAGETANSTAVIQSHQGASNMRSRLNDSTLTNSTISPATAIGHSCISRDNSANYAVYKSGALINTVVVASTAIANAAMGVCFAGTGFSTKRVQAAHVGAALSALQVASINSALSTYMTAVGA